MKNQTTGLLLAAAVVALGGGWWLSRTPVDEQPPEGGTLVFPGLGGKLDQADKIEISHQGTTLTLARAGAEWGLADKGGYKVMGAPVHALLEGLTELRMTEPRTSDPAEYKRLGVEDPKDPAATSDLLRVLTAKGEPLAELVVGHRRARAQADLPETVYIRRPGEAQAWLAEGVLPVETDPQMWIDRDILTVDHTKIASVTVQRKDATLRFETKDGKFALTAPPDHPKLDDEHVADVSRALENLTLNDVKPAAQEPGEKFGETDYTLTDGEKISVTVFRAGTPEKPETWGQFSASGAGDAKAAADKLDAKVKGWTYELAAWKEPSLLPNMDVLKAAEPVTPPGAGAGGAPGGMAGGMPPGMPGGLPGGQRFPNLPGQTPQAAGGPEETAPAAK